MSTFPCAIASYNEGYTTLAKNEQSTRCCLNYKTGSQCSVFTCIGDGEMSNFCKYLPLSIGYEGQKFCKC